MNENIKIAELYYEFALPFANLSKAFPSKLFAKQIMLERPLSKILFSTRAF